MAEVTFEALAGLAASTKYAYTAYSDNGCATKIAEETFSTTGPHKVSNLSLSFTTSLIVGNAGSILGNWRWATSFRTGSNTAGYTLNNVVVSLGANQGTPTSLTAKIYENNSSGDPDEAKTPINLGTVTPTGGSNQTWTCSGACDLAANKTYHLALETAAPSGGTSAYYQWNAVGNSGETNTPSNAGWQIGDEPQRRFSATSWSALNRSGKPGSRRKFANRYAMAQRLFYRSIIDTHMGPCPTG